MRLNIPLDVRKLHFIKEKSCYNDNFFQIELDGYDNYLFGNDVLREQCYEDENYYEYIIGRFENDVFVEVLSWTHYGEDSILIDEEKK